MLRILAGYLHRGFIVRLAVLIVGVFFANAIFATTTQLTLSTINSKVTVGIGNVVGIMQDIALVAGVGFIFSSFFKFHQHRQNPQQVPLSQGVTLLVIGAGLTVFPHLLSTAASGVFGTGMMVKAGTTAAKSVVVS